jgi:acetolactate synthase-1/2/3 large subunit
MTRPPTPETLAHRASAATPATVAAATGAAQAVTAVSPTPTTGAGALVRSLESLGVEVAFGIPGGAILPLYDPLYDSKVPHILVRH